VISHAAPASASVHDERHDQDRDGMALAYRAGVG